MEYKHWLKFGPGGSFPLLRFEPPLLLMMLFYA